MIKKINYDIIFNCIYFPLLILNILGKIVNISNTTLESLTYIITLLGLLFLLMIKVIIDKMSIENMFAIFILSVIFIIRVIVGNDYTHTYMLVPFLIGSQLLKSSNHTFLKYSFWAKVSLLVIVFSLGRIGILPSTQVIKSNGSVILSMGFVHTNSIGILGISILLDYILLNCRLYISSKNIILLFLFTIIIYQISLSRNFLLLSLGILIGLLSNKLLKNDYLKKATLQIATSIIFILGTFIWMYYNPNNFIWSGINKVLSNRPMLSKYYFNFYGIKWLPQNFERLSLDRFWDKIEYYLDNSFVQILLSQGLIIFILLFCFVLFVQQTKRFDFVTSLLIIFVYICLVIEAIPFNIFLLSPLFYQYFDTRSRDK